jgi:hypothetical protein
MKKFLFAILVAFAFSACSVTVNDPATKSNVRIRNTAWQIVKEDTVRSIRELTSTDALQAEIVAHNEANTDDQWFLEEGEEVPIEQSPDAFIFIVNSATLEKYYENIVPRTDIVALREYWRSAVETMADPDTGDLVSCTLYVDNIPPEPPIIIPPAPRLWTAVLDITSQLVCYSQHFDTEDEAKHQYSMNCLQADLNNAGLGDGLGNLGDVWQAYIGEMEYSF